MIKKLRNFIANSESELMKNGQHLRYESLVDVVRRNLTRVKWKHIKLSSRTKMSVKRAVELCSKEVAHDLLQNSGNANDNVQLAAYIVNCSKLFNLLNNSSEVDSSSYHSLLSIMHWFDKWYDEVKKASTKQPNKRQHWKKFIPRITYKYFRTTPDVL